MMAQRKRSDWRTMPRDEFWALVRGDDGQPVQTRDGQPVYEHHGWVQYLVAHYPKGYDYRPQEPSFAAGRMAWAPEGVKFRTAFEHQIGAHRAVNTPHAYSTWQRAIEPLHLFSEVRSSIERAGKRDAPALAALAYYQGLGPVLDESRTAFMVRERIASSRTVTERMYRGAYLVLDDLERARNMS